MQNRFFSFPNPVNDVAARSVGAGVLIMAIVCVATNTLWLTIPLAYGFVARVLTGPRLSPLGRLATGVIAPRLDRYKKLVPGPPKRFAQAMGATFTVSALVLWLVGEGLAARVLVGLLCVPALLESVFGYCVGCKIFAVLMRHGIISEAICLECADIYSRKTKTLQNS